MSQIHLTTYHSFLTGHFGDVRSQLLGSEHDIVPSIPEVAEITEINFLAKRGNLKVSKRLNQASTEPKKLFFTKPLKRFANTITNGIIIASIVAAISTAGILFIPKLYYSFIAAPTVPVVTAEEGTPLGGSFDQGALNQKPPEQRYQPPVDDSLPAGKWLVIPKIGVRTSLLETDNSEEALAKGVWLVPGYGQPGDVTQPLILAAHRYGWKWWWESDYWKYHSFYALPDLEPGDTVEIIANQQKWIYEIYGGEEGDEISDYQADLILYTCKFLNSPVRHFRYARLIDPTKNTQVSTQDTTSSNVDLAAVPEAGASGSPTTAH